MRYWAAHVGRPADTTAPDTPSGVFLEFLPPLVSDLAETRGGGKNLRGVKKSGNCLILAKNFRACGAKTPFLTFSDPKIFRAPSARDFFDVFLDFSSRSCILDLAGSQKQGGVKT